MINANELRIGNWVMIPIGRTFQIESIYETGINVDLEYGSIVPDYSFEVITPIALTPEILEKCGAQHNRIKLPNGKDYITFEPMQNVVTIDDAFGGILHVPFKQPLELHQLQNLYFALTGDELNVQL